MFDISVLTYKFRRRFNPIKIRWGASDLFTRSGGRSKKIGSMKEKSLNRSAKSGPDRRQGSEAKKASPLANENMREAIAVPRCERTERNMFH